MSRSQPPETQARFSGSLRHYHRGGVRTTRSWDDWVEGSAAKPKGNKNWVKISCITVGILALGGIVAGLIIELG